MPSHIELTDEADDKKFLLPINFAVIAEVENNKAHVFGQGRDEFYPKEFGGEKEKSYGVCRPCKAQRRVNGQDVDLCSVCSGCMND